MIYFAQTYSYALVMLSVHEMWQQTAQSIIHLQGRKQCQFVSKIFTKTLHLQLVLSWQKQLLFICPLVKFLKKKNHHHYQGAIWLALFAVSWESGLEVQKFKLNQEITQSLNKTFKTTLVVKVWWCVLVNVDHWKG